MGNYFSSQREGDFRSFSKNLKDDTIAQDYVEFYFF